MNRIEKLFEPWVGFLLKIDLTFNNVGNCLDPTLAKQIIAFIELINIAFNIV